MYSKAVTKTNLKSITEKITKEGISKMLKLNKMETHLAWIKKNPNSAFQVLPSSCSFANVKRQKTVMDFDV